MFTTKFPFEAGKSAPSTFNHIKHAVLQLAHVFAVILFVDCSSFSIFQFFS